MNFVAVRDRNIDDKPREKLAIHGAGALSDAELLAVLLGTGTKNYNALELSRQLLCEYKEIRRLLALPTATLLRHNGLGMAKIALLKASVELGRRYLGRPLLKGESIKDPTMMRNFLINRLRDRTEETFCLIFLDNRHRILGFEEMFKGTVDSAAVHPREVVRRSLEMCAAAVIAVHNHPSGVPTPSEADERITEKLKLALALLEIRLLDHIVVGEGEAVSFIELGLL